MSRTPGFGEVWLAHEATLLPGGLLYLIVSGEHYNTGTDDRIVVEVIGERLAAAGGALLSLGPLGSALVGLPMTVSATWFAGAAEPVAVLDGATAREAADAVRRLLGP